MSILYSFAVTFVLGKTGMEAFEKDSLQNVDVHNLTKKTVVSEDKEMTDVFPEKTMATVNVSF